MQPVHSPRVTRKSHSAALLRIRGSLKCVNRFLRARTCGSSASTFSKSSGKTPRRWLPGAIPGVRLDLSQSEYVRRLRPRTTARPVALPEDMRL